MGCTDNVPKRMQQAPAAHEPLQQLREGGQVPTAFGQIMFKITLAGRGAITYERYTGATKIYGYNELDFMSDEIITVIMQFLKTKTPVKIEQTKDKILCCNCKKAAMQFIDNAWVCKECGYKIKHYEVKNND